MIDTEWNFLKLTTNYLYSKITDQFSNKQFINNNEIFNQTNLAFLSALVDGLKSHSDEINSPIRFKLFVTYLLNLNARFIQIGNEDILNEIVKVLYNDFMIKTIPIDLLTKFKNIACKKICSMLNSNNIKKYKEAFAQLLENQLIDPSDYLESNDYSNEAMYEELCRLTREYLLSKSSSLLLEITRNFDFKNEQDETTLIEYFKMFKKKRTCSSMYAQLDESHVEQKKLKTSSPDETIRTAHSDDKQSSDMSSSKENQSPLKKKPENTRVSNIKISRLSTPSTKVKKSDLDKNKTPTKERCDEKKEDPYDYDEFNAIAPIEPIDPPTTSKETNAKTPVKRKQLIKSDDLIADSILKPRNESSLARNRSFNSSVSDLDFDASPSKNTRSKSSDKEKQEINQKKPNPLMKNKFPAKAVRNISHLIENISASSDTEEDSSSVEEKPVSKSKTNKIDDSMELVSSDSDEPDNRSFRPKLKTNRREAKKWTEKETVYLAVGIELYGKGQWAIILDKLNKHFNDRTSVNLKDKWRNIERYNQAKQLQKQAAIIIQRMQDEKKH